MDQLDEIETLPVAPWKGKEALISDSDTDGDDGGSSSSSDEGLESFDANPRNAGNSSFDEEDVDEESESEQEEESDDEYLDSVATADDVAAWASGLAPAPRLRRGRELRYDDGSSYHGDTLGGLRHGRGVLKCPNGDRYEGQWRLGKRHGKGKAVFPSRGDGAGDVGYDGDWRDDNAHGHGRATYENGGVYVGAFSEGVRCGWGRHVFPTAAAGEEGGTSRRRPRREACYEGEWLDDAPHGNGVHSCPSEGTFVGEWRRGSRSRGCWTSADGKEEYEGEWAVVAADDEKALRCPAKIVDPLTAAVRHGKGTLTILGVSKYVGDWERDLPSGEGEWIHADGSRYRGSLLSGERHGRGSLERADGSFYRGEWREGREHGTGKALLPCGDEYEGEWSRGKRHGTGKGTCGPRSEDFYEGEWREGERHGRGRCVFGGKRGDEGDVYDGQWDRGQRHGFGTCVFEEDGVRFQGQWRRGEWVQRSADAALSELVACENEGDDGKKGDGADVGKGAPAKKHLGLLPLLSAVAGRRSSFIIRARDSNEQPRLSGGDSFVVWVECGVDSRCGGGEGEGDEGDGGVGDKDGQTQWALFDPTRRDDSKAPPHFLERVDADVTDRGDGTYGVSYVPRVAGEARLHVSLLSPSASASASSSSTSTTTAACYENPPSNFSFVPVADSPYTLRVEPGPPAKRQELVSGLPREIFRGNEKKETVFWVQPRDEFGNACGPRPSPSCSSSPAFAVSEVVARIGSSYEARARTRQLPDGRIECTFPAFGEGCPIGLGTVEVLLLSSPATTARHARGSPFSLSVVADATAKATEAVAPAVEDKTAEWERAAQEAYVAVDGDGAGWDSDGGGGGRGGRRRQRSGPGGGGDDEGDSAESLSLSHPGVPIVERLEDIWQVAKLHRERRERDESERGAPGAAASTATSDGEEDDDALGAAEVAAKAAEDASRAAVDAAVAKHAEKESDK